LKTKIH